MKWLSLCILLLALTSYAQPGDITVYTQPNRHSPTMATININTVTAFYRQNEWLKVGNRLDGNVGWVESVDYEQARYTQMKLTTMKKNSTTLNQDHRLKHVLQQSIQHYSDNAMYCGMLVLPPTLIKHTPTKQETA